MLWRQNQSYWLSFWPTGIGIHRFSGSWESGVLLGANDNPAFGALGSHTFRLELKGPAFKVFVDGKEAMNIKDPLYEYEFGSIVLCFDDVAFSFDDIKIETL